MVKTLHENAKKTIFVICEKNVENHQKHTGKKAEHQRIILTRHKRKNATRISTKKEQKQAEQTWQNHCAKKQ